MGQFVASSCMYFQDQLQHVYTRLKDEQILLVPMAATPTNHHEKYAMIKMVLDAGLSLEDTAWAGLWVYTLSPQVYHN